MRIHRSRRLLAAMLALWSVGASSVPIRYASAQEVDEAPIGYVVEVRPNASVYSCPGPVNASCTALAPSSISRCAPFTARQNYFVRIDVGGEQRWVPQRFLVIDQTRRALEGLNDREIATSGSRALSGESQSSVSAGPRGRSQCGG